jgi:OmpA-OmpF porin, OOP family
VNKKNLIITFVTVAALYLVGDYFGYLPGMIKQESAVPTAVDLSSAVTGDVAELAGNVAAVELPSNRPAAPKGVPIRLTVYPWTALHGVLFAVGGPTTTEGSIAAKAGLNVRIERQDDVEKMKASQLQFANAFAEGQAHPSVGTHFVNIMGDGAAQYIAAMNQSMEDIGLKAVVIGAVGYSRGEDAWWGPQEWKDNPSSMAGGVTAAYLRDGDWNLAQYKLANDGVKNNPDETTYDPDAMNWVSTNDFLKATEAYVSGYCEDRKVVRAGKLTGETKNICVQGVATWTPGDVNLAKQKGGLVKLISTKENAFQMPATLIGIDGWVNSNRPLVEKLLQAFFEGGDQVKHHDQALSRAATIAVNVYGAETAAYWAKYYRGSRERDKTNQLVELGGSVTANLADNLILFGLAPGAGGLKASLYNATYTGFGNVVKQQYPRLFPSFPPIEEAVNTSFVSALAAKAMPNIEEEAVVATFNEDAGPIAAEATVAKRDWNITFQTGSASFSPAALETLTELYNQLLVGGALAVQIDGHTDNVGNPDANLALSEARAFAVKEYLESKAARLFPAGRISVRSFGQTAPVASNSTPEGRAKNRRVTITLGVQ